MQPLRSSLAHAAFEFHTGINFRQFLVVTFGNGISKSQEGTIYLKSTDLLYVPTQSKSKTNDPLKISGLLQDLVPIKPQFGPHYVFFDTIL